jgi:two-component system CheB/CheR fusion protein
MANRNTELNRVNNDLVNLQSSTKLAIVLLARDLTIRRFTAQAEKELGLLAVDVSRPIGHIRHNFVLDSETGEAPRLDLERLIDEVITNVREDFREVRDKAGRWLVFLACAPLHGAEEQDRRRGAGADGHRCAQAQRVK